VWHPRRKRPRMRRTATPKAHATAAIKPCCAGYQLLFMGLSEAGRLVREVDVAIGLICAGEGTDFT